VNRGQILDLPVGEIDLPIGEIDLPIGEIDLRAGEIDLPIGEIDLHAGEIDLPIGEVDLYGREVNGRPGLTAQSSDRLLGCTTCANRAVVGRSEAGRTAALSARPVH